MYAPEYPVKENDTFSTEYIWSDVEQVEDGRFIAILRIVQFSVQYRMTLV